MALPELTIVVPARNAAPMLEACLSSARACEPAEIILVDGCSTDGTVDIARQYVDRILSDEGGGLPVARLLGAQAATTRYVLLLDTDVVLPPGSVGQLLDEFRAGRYDALQAGLYSTSGPGYWGRALAEHHRTGLSKAWFGLVATVLERDTVITHGFDNTFASGEDIELRWRLAKAGLKLGVSQRSIVQHRFADDSFEFALGQFTADGYGLGLMIRKHPVRGLGLIALPLAAGLRGTALSALRGAWQWLPYFAAYTVFNYRAMWTAIVRTQVGTPGTSMGTNAR